MKRNNLWNRVFHRKAVNAIKAQMIQSELLIQNSTEVLARIKCAQGDFIKLFEAHVFAHQQGFYNLTPNENLESIFDLKIGEPTYKIAPKSVHEWMNDFFSTFGENKVGIKPETMLRDLVLRNYYITLFCKVSEQELYAHGFVRECHLCGY